jgi:uncharacterized protein (TIGR02246 family)
MMQKTISDIATEIAAQWEAAWNAHDMSRVAHLITDDADWVTVAGTRLCGRAQIEDVHRVLHGHQLRASTWTNTHIEASPCTPGAILVHLSWSVQGDLNPDGTPRASRNGIFTWVLVQTGGSWRIRAAHATNVLQS